jgi:hypothetical protein
VQYDESIHAPDKRIRFFSILSQNFVWELAQNTQGSRISALKVSEYLRLSSRSLKSHRRYIFLRRLLRN